MRNRLWRVADLTAVVGLVAIGLVVAVAPRNSPAEPKAPVAVIATATSDQVRVYHHKGGSHVWKRLDNPNPQGAQLVFLVESRQPHWVKVLLPVRPNDGEGWVRAGQVTLSSTAYRIDVWLDRHRVVVHHDDKTIMRTTAAVGKHSTPTPTGRFYLTALLRPPSPHGPYGPYAFGLSAYSDVIYHFGGGPGQIGLHGTDEPALLGKSISHGCIRIANKHITTLAHRLPLGTPVTVHG
ncbi:MAG: L,D-transpeptidase [Streptosporangiaceae bacterium]